MFPVDAVNNVYEPVWRMGSAATAGTFATLLTHPLDVVRARLTVVKDAKGKLLGNWDSGLDLFSVARHRSYSRCSRATRRISWTLQRSRSYASIHCPVSRRAAIVIRLYEIESVSYGFEPQYQSFCFVWHRCRNPGANRERL